MQSSRLDAPSLTLRLKNALASVAVVVLACTVYGVLPGNDKWLLKLYGPPQATISGLDFLIGAAGVYVALLAAYFMSDPAPGVSKSLRFVRVLGRVARSPSSLMKGGLAPEERLAVLSTLLKVFFGPMMCMFLMTHCMGAWATGSTILATGISDFWTRAFFDKFGYWFLMQTILFVDVLLFTIGYLVESRRLGNEIRSVDPTLLGWTAALLCYPPLSSLTGKLLGAPVSDFPQFDNPDVHIALNLTLLALMAVYTSASVALGLKASNLTHRGVIARGPYAFIRHPAYTCKNLAWWIGATPLVITEFGKSLTQGLAAAGSMVAWSALYALRALTEEDHLKRVDGEYAAYAAKVRYRFIPGII